MTFHDLGLGPKVLQAVEETGYTEPTPIQAEAIPKVLQAVDVLGIAQTGTGKTASFTLPMIEILSRGRARARMPRSLILEPTRELAAQVAENFETYGKYHKLSMALLIGGVSFTEQEKKLDRGVDVLIATPGRLLDHFERGKVMLNGVGIFVVDESDRMLDMGFIPDIERICKMLPFTRQTLFFSATMPPEIQRLTDSFLHNPVKIEVARVSSAASTVEQRLLYARREDKRAVLRTVIDKSEELKNAIIFCNRKRDVGILERSMTKHGYSAGALHGDLDQHTRMRTLESFRNGDIAFLVASDVAARGLDIPDVSHVFNFDIPTHPEDYIHRIGRTGRAGRSGSAFSIVSDSDQKYVLAIEKLLQTKLERDTRFESTNVVDGQDQEAIPKKQPRKSPGAKNPDKKRAGKKITDTGKSAKTLSRNDAAPSSPAPEKEDKPSPTPGKDKASSEAAVVGLGDHVPAFLSRPAGRSTGKPARTKPVTS